jgi:hypothetical protein
MAIDLTEPLIPLAQVPAQPFVPRRRGGKRLNVSTVFRWVQQGLAGVRLEAIRFGGTLCTSKGALLEFFRRITPASDMSLSPHLRTPQQRLRASERAARELGKLRI